MGNVAGGHLRACVLLNRNGICEGVRVGGKIAEDGVLLMYKSGCASKLMSIHAYGGRVKICGGWNARWVMVFVCRIGNEGRGGGERAKAEAMGMAKKASTNRKRRPYIKPQKLNLI